MEDPFNLERFVEAQEPVFESVLAELRQGRKTGHWMWFIFPQIKGLGSSSMATYYGISSRAEAEAYLAHPTLGSRLIECTTLVNQIEGAPVEAIFGSIDAMKLRSSMTLFAEVGPANGVFQRALDKYFHGHADEATLARLRG